MSMVWGPLLELAGPPRLSTQSQAGPSIALFGPNRKVGVPDCKMREKIGPSPGARERRGGDCKGRR